MKFDYNLILCPTIWINKTYSDWKYLEIDLDKLNIILKHIIDTYSGSRTAIIIDDMSEKSENPTRGFFFFRDAQ